MRKHLFVFGAVFILLGASLVLAGGGGKPYCGAVGTRSEGWYDLSGLIRWDNCNGISPICLYGGTEKEGWYEPLVATVMQDPVLIKYDDACDGMPGHDPIITPVPTTTVRPTPTPLIEPPVYSCWTSGVQTMKQGSAGDSVKELQSLLGQDKTIYPEGLVTGYFGSLTREAVKRLESKLGLPQTGEANENVRKYIYPCYELRVAQPNGGETFPVGDVMRIFWELKSTATESLNSQSSALTMDKMMILPRTWSIDLIETSGAGGRCLMMYPEKCLSEEKIVYHVQTQPLKGNSGSYEWTIPSTIPESKNYKIKVSLQAGGSPCPPGAYCVMNFMPSWQVSDSSDNVFAITGGQPQPTPTVSVTPLPTITPQPDLVRMRNEVTEMIKKLQEILENLNKLLGIQ